MIRAEIGIECVHGGAPPEVARCVAGKITDDYSVDELNTADTAQFETPEFIDQVRGYATECVPG